MFLAMILNFILGVGDGKPPATCEAALREYATIEEVPKPFSIIPLDVELADSNIRTVLARNGATGFTLVTVAEKDMTKAEKKAVKTFGLKEVYRTVGVFVPADSARVQDMCARIANGTF